MICFDSFDSHLITVPAGPHILSDILLSSPIIVGEGGGGGFGAAGTLFIYFFKAI